MGTLALQRIANGPECATCHSQPGEPVLDGWGNLMQPWDAWPCLFCGVMVCNHPHGNDWTCYVRHTAEKHPEQYQPGGPGPTVSPQKKRAKR